MQCTAVNVSASGELRTLDPLQTHTSLPPCYKILAAPLTFTHRTTSCFYRLHCTVFIGSNCSLFAARLSRYTSAYSLLVQYCSESNRHRYRKMKMKIFHVSSYSLQFPHSYNPFPYLFFPIPFLLFARSSSFLSCIFPFHSFSFPVPLQWRN